MPLPDSIVAGDIVVREFSGNYLIWRVLEQKTGSFWGKHVGLGQSDNWERAISRACELAGSKHAVWFCDTHERYRQIC